MSNNILEQFLKTDKAAKDFIQGLKEQEYPEVIDLKQELLRIDQDIADLKIRQLETDDPDEKEDISAQIEDLNADKEAINDEIADIKGD